MRDYERVLNKKNTAQFSTELAQKHPEKYREVMKRLHDIGKDAAYTTNGLSFGLKDIRQTLAAKAAQIRVKRDLRTIMADRRLSPEQRKLKILALSAKTQKELVEEVAREAEDQDNPLVRQVSGTGVGNKFSLNSLIGADMQYVDHKNEPIPLPVVHNYSQGLTPAEYFAGAFGTRKGVMDLKTATADAGFLASN